jgi:dTDP-4-dehydrorhamnose 3,5-epimerase
MIFTETRLHGACIIELEPHADERGFFARTFCREEFILHGLNPDIVQCNISFNKKKGTLRGMHYQAKPFEETKLVWCNHGAIYDVVIDLRPESPTHRQWISVELTQANHKAVYVPAGCAHGFQTLTDNAEVFYQISQLHHPEAARGVRWDDPAFGITWPVDQKIISSRDQGYPDFPA